MLPGRPGASGPLGKCSSCDGSARPRARARLAQVQAAGAGQAAQPSLMTVIALASGRHQFTVCWQFPEARRRRQSRWTLTVDRDWTGRGLGLRLGLGLEAAATKSIRDSESA
jgi:hypothetical protein